MSDPRLQPVVDLVERITKSTVMKGADQQQTVLRHLAINHFNGPELTEEAIRRATHAGRETCLRIRDAFSYYFLYTKEGVQEKMQLNLPRAATIHTWDEDLEDRLDLQPDRKASGRMPRLYRLMKSGREDQPLHTVKGADLFWHPHLVVSNEQQRKTIVVFTEPVVFRHKSDQGNGFFIRHLDINEPDKGTQMSEAVYISQLINKLMESGIQGITAENLVLSRAYIPGGEVLAKDAICDWMSKRIHKIAEQGNLPTEGGIVVEEVSRHIAGVNDDKIKGSHTILLGSGRANWLIREFQERTGKWMSCIEPNGILIKDCTPAEIAKIAERLMDIELSGEQGGRLRKITKSEADYMLRRISEGNLLLSEDWSKLSFALVSREIGIHSEECVTVITANQGRGIQAVAEKVLTKDETISELIGTIGGTLPAAFQMVFAVALKDQEADHGHWKLLLYRDLHDHPERPKELKDIPWPKGVKTPEALSTSHTQTAK